MNSLSHVSLSEKSETLFAKAIKVVAPWASMLSTEIGRLENDLPDERILNCLTSLKAMGDPSSTELVTTLLSAKLTDKTELDRDEVIKIVLLFGDKDIRTLFSKSYVLDKLRSYTSDKPTPLFVSLASLKDPVGNLMDELLEQKGLLSQKNYLKKKSLLLFCDDFEKIGLNHDGTKTNIYQTNHLGTFWPNVKLIITCGRDHVLTEDYKHFWPARGKKATISISPKI